jgi:NADH:ubiquinone oxidoreductase subunit D
MVDDIRKLLIEVPKRAQYLRVIIMELAYYRSLNVIRFLVLIQCLYWISICFQFREGMRSTKKFVVSLTTTWVEWF